MSAKQSLEERFWSKVQAGPSGECWPSPFTIRYVVSGRRWGVPDAG